MSRDLAHLEDGRYAAKVERCAAFHGWTSLEHPRGSIHTAEHTAVTLTVSIRRDECGHYFAGSVRFSRDADGLRMAREHGRQLLEYTACNLCARRGVVA